VSPTKKMPRIPTTPHRPSMDSFWSQELVDDWNLEHSPRKLFQAQTETNKSAKQGPPREANITGNANRKEKKSFDQSKNDMAKSFLKELDDTIAAGQLGRLAASNGGIAIIWSNKLNTTAGRANWRRETVRSKQANGDETIVQQHHHASIELADKVIDDQNRLLNVIAHEFCHLANFMISGVTGNPHGKEFKAWAAKCTSAFGDRGIEVTTRHSYDIDFKYVWECACCGLEFKRHSKSIKPERHRCGSCKGELRQTKPVPRKVAGTSKYQEFMKEQMATMKRQNPGSPQKDIMKMVAQRWSQKNSEAGRSDSPAASQSIDDELAGQMGQLGFAGEDHVVLNNIYDDGRRPGLQTG